MEIDTGIIIMGGIMIWNILKCYLVIQVEDGQVHKIKKLNKIN